MLGDGELAEGQTWECIQAASHYKLDNLIIVIDANDQQVEGQIENQMTLEPLIARFRAFGAEAVEVNGHNIEEFCSAFNTPHEGKPLIVLGRTRGTTGIPPLEKRWPFLHFVRISADEKEEFQKVYDAL